MPINGIKRLKLVKYNFAFEILLFAQKVLSSVIAHHSASCDFTRADSTASQKTTHPCVTTEKGRQLIRTQELRNIVIKANVVPPAWGDKRDAEGRRRARQKRREGRSASRRAMRGTLDGTWRGTGERNAG